MAARRFALLGRRHRCAIYDVAHDLELAPMERLLDPDEVPAHTLTP